MELVDSVGSGLAKPMTRREARLEALDAIRAMEEAEKHLKVLMSRVTDFLAMAKSSSRFQLIQNAVASEYGIDVRRLFGKEKPRCVVLPRHVAMYFCRVLLEETETAISKEFNRRDHGTVYHAWKQVRNLLETDKNEAERIESLRSRLECMLKSL